MTILKPVSIYELHPDELENLGYDISGLTQETFNTIAHRLIRELEDGTIPETLDGIAQIYDLPVR